MLDHICAERSGGVMVLSRLHLAVDHSVDVDVLRGVDVDIYIMRRVQVGLMLAEGRAGRIASPVFDDGRIIGSGGRTVFFCLRDGLRLDIRKVDGIAVQTSDLIRIEVRVLAEVRRTVEIHFRNNGVLLAGVLHQNVRPAVDGVVLAELPLGRIVLIPLVMRMADLIQLDVLCCEVVQQVAAFASHTGEKLRLGGLVIVSDRFDDDLLIVIDHADDIRPAVDRDRLKTCGRVFGVLLVVVPLAVVVPAVEVVFAGAVCGVVVGNVERSQINDCTLRLRVKRNCLECLGHVAIAVDHELNGLHVRLPDGGEGNVADDSPLMVCRIQRLAVGLGVRGDDRRILRSAPAEEGVALAGRLAQSNVIVYQIVTVGGHVLDFVVRPGIKRDALERHGAVEMVSVDLAVGFVALVCGIGHELQRVLAVPANAVQHALVELFGIDLAVERELAIVNLVCHACNVGLRGHQLAEGDELAACVEAFREAKTRKRRNGLRIALGKSNALVGRLHVDIDGLFHILQLAIELPILGIIECLGALVGIAEVLRILIPAVKLVAVLFNTLGLEVRAEVVFRNVDRFAVRFDLVAVLVIDGVGDGMIPVGFDSQVAGRASRNLGDCFLAAAVQIAAPLQEGLAEHAFVRDGVQSDSIFNRVRLSVFGIKILILNVLVAVVVRDRVLDGCVVAVEFPLLKLRRRIELSRSCFADVLLGLIPAVELIAVRNIGHPQLVGRSLRGRNVFLIYDLPTVAVLYRVSYKEGALFPDGVEGHRGIARGKLQLFTGLDVFCRIGWNRLCVRAYIPAEERVADALRNFVAEDELCHLARKLKRLRYRIGHVFNIAPIRVVGQRGLADHINLRAIARAGLLPLARFGIIPERPLRIHGRRVFKRVALVQSSCLHVACNIKRQPGGIALLLDGVCAFTVRNNNVVLLVDGALEENAQVGNIKVLLAGCRNHAGVNFLGLHVSINFVRPTIFLDHPFTIFPIPIDKRREDLIATTNSLFMICVVFLDCLLHCIVIKPEPIHRAVFTHIAVHLICNLQRSGAMAAGATRIQTYERNITIRLQLTRYAMGLIVYVGMVDIHIHVNGITVRSVLKLPLLLRFIPFNHSVDFGRGKPVALQLISFVDIPRHCGFISIDSVCAICVLFFLLSAKNTKRTGCLVNHRIIIVARLVITHETPDKAEFTQIGSFRRCCTYYDLIVFCII